MIRYAPNAVAEAIIYPWPKAFDPGHALAPGFEPDASFEALATADIEDRAAGLR